MNAQQKASRRCPCDGSRGNASGSAAGRSKHAFYLLIGAPMKQPPTAMVAIQSEANPTTPGSEHRKIEKHIFQVQRILATTTMLSQVNA